MGREFFSKGLSVYETELWKIDEIGIKGLTLFERYDKSYHCECVSA
jgi:hypothetical protein